MSELRLIAGLGNPGKDYASTRHNLGFLAVQRLAGRLGLKFALSPFAKGMAAEGRFEAAAVCLLLPLTYMNHSGEAVRQVVAKKKLSPADVMIVCDDVHLDFGRLRVKAGGGDGGHNGLRSVIQCLGTEQFARLRMGIGRPAGKKDTVEYVLEEFKKKEKEHLDLFLSETVSCCLAWLTEGINAVMDRYNRRP